MRNDRLDSVFFVTLVLATGLAFVVSQCVGANDDCMCISGACAGERRWRMTGRYDDVKAGPFGPKRRQVLAHLVTEAVSWVREDGAPEHALPELFAEALTLVLERCGKLERPSEGDGQTGP